MKHILFVAVLFVLLVSGVVYAVEPTQQFNKILLNPFYTASMTQNTNYTFTVQVNPPDGVSEVKSAIINLDVWINPARTFSAWVNGIACRNPSYTISTTFAGAGRAVPTFDCGNVITRAGNYTVKFLVAGGNTGASTAWLDLTYMNDPIGEITVHGTEYVAGDLGKTFLQLLDAQHTPMMNASCFVRGYNPDATSWFNYTIMTSPMNNTDGMYFYDFSAPSQQGVYMLSAYCTLPALSSTRWTDDFECNGLSCGSPNWNGSWVTSDTDVLSVTGQGINLYALSWKDTDNAQRNFTTSACSSGETFSVTFWAKAASDLDAGRNCNYEYYNGSHYVELLHINNTMGGYGQWRYSSTNVCSYAKSNATMALRVSKTGGGAKLCYIDNIEIVKTHITPGIEYQELRGSGEVHVNGWFASLPEQVWEYEPRNLTYYPPQENVTNTTIQTLYLLNNNTLLLINNTNNILLALENLNISLNGTFVCNMTNLQQNLTQTIINEGSEPLTFSFNVVLLIILALLLILAVFAKSGGFVMICAMGIILIGLALIPLMSVWFGLIIIGLGALFVYSGYTKLW